MKVRKFLAANSREALSKARAELGAEAVVLSSRKTPDGFEILALAKDDIATLVSAGRNDRPIAVATPPARPASRSDAASAVAGARPRAGATGLEALVRPLATVGARSAASPSPASRGAERAPALLPPALVAELRALRGMVEEQSASLAWMQAGPTRPQRAALLRELMSAGFSPALSRQVVDAVPGASDGEAARQWLAQALLHNLRCAAAADDPFERGGAFALVGPTGVGKTTTTAKLAARCVVRHGAQALGLVSADTYRIGAQDQLRIYGRILGVPVHGVHDAESLRATLAALAGKRLVLVDTTGVGQRDARVAEQAATLEAAGVRRVLLLGAPSQSETLEEVVQAYRGNGIAAAVLTKVDEAASLGGALDVVIRHRLLLTHVTSGQRVPEDLHPANGTVLVHRALKTRRAAALQMDDAECGLLAFGATPHAATRPGERTAHAAR